MNISEVPVDVLEKDLKESKEDIENCARALLAGITSYSGGLVQDRLDTNKRIVAKIQTELERRQNENARSDKEASDRLD